MMFQKILLLFSFYLLTWNLRFSCSKLIERRDVFIKDKECEIYGLSFQKCDTKVSRFGNERFKVNFIKSCNIKDISFSYLIEKAGEYSITIVRVKSVITVSQMKKKLAQTKKVFEPGTHTLTATMTAKSLKDVKLSTKSEKCKFYVRNENATASLGRLNRRVQSGKNFIVNASQSINNDLEKNNQGLEYKWTCNSTSDFCNDTTLEKKSTLEVPAKYAIQGISFNFTVQVRSIPTKWQSAIQFITVDDNSPFVVNCVENCGKYPNTLTPSQTTWLEATCEFSCDQYDKNLLFGGLYKQKSNRLFHAWSNFKERKGLNSSGNTGRSYYAAAIYGNPNKGGKILGKTLFKILEFPKLTNCKTDPPKGAPLTKFKVKCDYDVKTKKYFEVRVKIDETVVFSQTSPNLEDIEFLVPGRTAIVVVKLENTDNVFIEVEIPVQIESLVTGKKNVTSAVDGLSDIYEGKNGTAVKEMIKEGDHEKAVQMIEVVARELDNVKAKTKEDAETIKTLKKKCLGDISIIPVDDINMSKSVSGVMKLIAGVGKENETDSEMAKLLASTCRNAAKQQRYLVENDIEDNISQNATEDVTHNLMSCSESQMSPNYGIFQETEIDIELTTKFPINDNLSEKNFEDYPQYVADDLIEQQVSEFLSAAEYMVDVCRNMASSLIHKVEIDMEEPKYVLRKNSMFSWMKSSGSLLTQTKFKQFNVTIQPSPFLEKFSKVSMQVCSYMKDPFWSLSEHHKIPTNVIDVKSTDELNGEVITNFGDQPMNISFEVFQHLVSKKISNITVNNPNDYSEFREDGFNIVVIKARKEASFVIDFPGIKQNDHFEVVVMDMERPQLKHFDDSLHLNFFNKKLFIQHNAKSDKWFLLAIRPHRKLGTQKERFLVYSVYTPMCVSWSSKKNRWKFACSVYLTTSYEMIECRCLHLSTLAGLFDYNELRPLPKFIKLEFALEEAQSLFFVIVVCSLLLVYFYLLLYSIQKNETIEDAVYLMSDVPAENKFAYLVVVKTGKRIHSGTTSHVVIRLIGTDSESQEHVVNFPDPLGELLQSMQEDYFILATPVHLGQLEKIHVWFDSTGMSPTWYCQDFRICDLQTKTWYFFKINRWFKVEGKPTIFMNVATATVREEAKENLRSIRFLRSLLNFGRFNNTMWRMSTSSTNINFGYPKRLTLILSVFLTILTVSIELHGRPEMNVRDSITPDCYFYLDGDLVLKGICSASITFLPHLAIMEGFKNSRLQFQRHSKSFPPGFTIFFWCILISNITLQLHYLLIYGYRVIEPKRMDCFVASLFGFIFYVFILDYIYNLLGVLFGGPLKTVGFNYEKILSNVEEQRRFLYKFIGRYIYRPILTPLYEIMSTADLMKKKFHFRQRREMIWQVHDFFMVITFILLLYIIVLGDKDWIYDYRGHTQALKLIKGFERNKLKLERVIDFRDFENFMEKTFIPAIQSYQWYGQYVSDSPGMTSDGSNRYLGVIRFRQHRVEDDSCVVLEKMRFLNATCRAPNYFFHFDTYNYTPAWKKTIPGFHRSKLGYVWGHHKGVGRIFLGLTGYYDSGGYVAELGRTISNSFVNFNYLKRYNWIDPLTRAVVIEFALYNVNLNLFHFVEVVLEKSETGYINKDVTVQTERLMKHSSVNQKIAMICCIIFVLLVSALGVRTVIRIIETKVWYKSDFWHIVDVVIMALSIAWIGLLFERVAVLRAFAKHLEQKRSNAFVNYFPILGITDWMKTLEGLLICLSTIRMWRILRFGATFRTVERTLMYSANSLFIMSFYYIIFLIGFGIPTYVILGSQVEDFRHPYFSFKTLILNSIGIMNIKADEVARNEMGLGYIFYVLYSCYCKFLLTLLIAIILVEYIKAREFSLSEVLDYNLKDYTIDTYGVLKRRAFVLARKFRLTAGGNPPAEKSMVTPKHDDLRYKNCVETDSNRMKAMACVAKCVLLKLQKGVRVDETDHALMLRTVNNLYVKEDGKKEIFFVETRNDGIRVVDDRRILMIEKMMKLMLEIPEDKAKEIERINQEIDLRDSNMARMMRMNRRLELMLNIIKNIEISISSNRDDV